ncbi:MAG: response regulator [Bryobacterales bacterium]|nr:response regulator [Bryobacterales bacterium]
MMKQGATKILALVSDLLFTVKINEAAKRNGMQIDYVKNDDDFLARLHEKPAPKLVIMDLNISSASPVELIEKIKGQEETKAISVLGYVSHIQGDLKVKAQEAGADAVLARSAFSQNLVQILKRHSGMP